MNQSRLVVPPFNTSLTLMVTKEISPIFSKFLVNKVLLVRAVKPSFKKPELLVVVHIFVQSARGDKGVKILVFHASLGIPIKGNRQIIRLGKLTLTLS